MMDAASPLAPGVPATTSSRRAWPVLTALVLMLSAVAMVAATAFLQDRRDRSKRMAEQMRVQLAQAAEHARLQPVAATASVDEVPLLHTHLDDVDALLRLSQQKGVSIGALQIRSDPGPDASYKLRVVEFRIEEEYPKLKAYLADLLLRFPHLYLDELRVDQGSAAGGKVQATLRLTLVYQTSADPQANVAGKEGLR